MCFVLFGEFFFFRWFGNLKFVGFVFCDEDEDSVYYGFVNGKNVVLVQERLFQVQNMMQVYEVIRDLFFVKVWLMLQIEGVDDDVFMRMCSNEIGMDLFIVVDICFWFFKQFFVSIFVFKIFNGVLIGEFVDEVVVKIFFEFVLSFNLDLVLFFRFIFVGFLVLLLLLFLLLVFNFLVSLVIEVIFWMLYEMVGEVDQDFVLFLKGKQFEIFVVMIKLLIFERFISFLYIQFMFWVVYLLFEDKIIFNYMGFICMMGWVWVQDFKVVVQQFLNCYESMCVCFYLEDYVVKQGIFKMGRVELEYREIGSYEEVE